MIFENESSLLYRALIWISILEMLLIFFFGNFVFCFFVGTSSTSRFLLVEMENRIGISAQTFYRFPDATCLFTRFRLQVALGNSFDVYDSIEQLGQICP